MYFLPLRPPTSIETVRDLEYNQMQLKFSIKWKLEMSDGLQKFISELLSLSYFLSVNVMCFSFLYLLFTVFHNR